MRYFNNRTLLSAACVLLTALSSHLPSPAPADDGIIRVNLLQLNDVYEISSLEQGLSAGMARVATLRNELAKENPNTYTMLAGDFLSPSAIGTLTYEGRRIMGRQMVELMNAVPVNLVTFGNHEFDLREELLQQRINESRFDWVSANILHKTAGATAPFVRTAGSVSDTIPATRIVTFTDADGTTLRMGVFGVTIETPDINYVAYRDYLSSAREALAQLNGKCDIIVALTHLELKDDKILAQAFPEINFIIGGHEHENSYTRIGNTFIAKADANARTAYVHTLEYNSTGKRLDVSSKLVVINNAITGDAQAAALVNTWNRRADSALLAKGITPCEPVAQLPEPFDGREASVRTKQTNLTHSIAAAMTQAAAAYKPDFSLYNGGSIRLDDVLEGSITQYDLFRALPFGGFVVMAQLRGSLLDSLRRISDTSAGNGCFLQYDLLERAPDSSWVLRGAKLDPRKLYRVAMTDFLVSGGEKRMSFLRQGYPGLTLDTPRVQGKEIDLLKSWAAYLNNLYKPAANASPSKGVPCY